MLFCDPKFIFTDRMKITMGEDAFEGLKEWHEDTVSRVLDEASNVICKYCKAEPCFLDDCYEQVLLGVGGECEELAMTNKEIRYHMYHEASKLWSGNPGRGKRYKLPYCARLGILEEFRQEFRIPDSSGRICRNDIRVRIVPELQVLRQEWCQS
jgi:hypothetical protein